MVAAPRSFAVDGVLSYLPSKVMSMSISERSRKILWVKAGGRCSLCRLQVAGGQADSDDPSVFGRGPARKDSYVSLAASRHPKLVGTLRREILDRVPIHGEDHLRAVLSQYLGALKHGQAASGHRPARL